MDSTNTQIDNIKQSRVFILLEKWNKFFCKYIMLHFMSNLILVYFLDSVEGYKNCVGCTRYRNKKGKLRSVTN